MPPWIRSSRALPSSSICEHSSPQKRKQNHCLLLMPSRAEPQASTLLHFKRRCGKRWLHPTRHTCLSPSPVPLPSWLLCNCRLPWKLRSVRNLTKTNEQRHDWVEQGGKPDREVMRGSYRRMANFVVSTTDPDATVMPTKGQGRH